MSRKSGETWGTPIASFASRTGKSAPELAEVFDPSVIAESGVNGRISELGKSVGELVGQINGVRYDIPDWQRSEVWNRAKKQRLIDSILRGWKLPKFYFIEQIGEDYLVEDGQQRLNAIWEFFSNELPLSTESAAKFKGKYYRDLPRAVADGFDDFEIDFDVISGATDAELKEFFQRLQEGMPLTSSEKLNAVPSKLTDFCRSAANHPFFAKTVAIPNTRYAHFDILTKGLSPSRM
jgi:hypothetical protein